MVGARAVTIEVQLRVPLGRSERAALTDAVARYGEFVGLPAAWRDDGGIS